MSRRKPARGVSFASGVTPTTHGLERLESRTLFAAVDFTINPALSTLRLSGEVAGVLELDEQHGGSLLQAYEGTIKADLDADSIEFVGGSEIVARSSGTYDPGDGPANYGGEGETGGFISVRVGDAAIRGLKLDVTSPGEIALGEGGAFPADAVDFKTTAGTLEFELRVGGDGDVDLGGETMDNHGVGNASVRGEGENRTLLIPVDITYSEDETELRLRGTLVATTGTGAPVDNNAARVGTGAARSVQFTDADGTTATVALKGGTADLRFENATQQTLVKNVLVVGGPNVRLLGIDALGTRASSKLTINAAGGGDGVVTVGGVTADGPLGTLGGRGVTLTGTIDVNGPLGTLAAANVAGATITAASVGTLKVARDVTDSTVTLDAPLAAGVPALRSATIGGTMSGSRLSAAGNIGVVKVRDLVGSGVYSGDTGPDRFPAAASVPAGGGIAAVTTKTFGNSVLAGDTLGKLKLGVVDTDNGGTPFGISGDVVLALQATNASREKLKLAAQDDPAALAAALAAQAFTTGDFEIRVV